MRLASAAIFICAWAVAALTARAEKIDLVAGGGTEKEGPAARVKLGAPFGVAFDRAGNLYLVEMTGHRVLRLDKHGQLTAIAGSGAKGPGGDGGPALQAQFNGMHALAVGPAGDLYLADTWNNRIRRLDPQTGALKTIAGTGAKGFGGDGGPADKALFGGLYCVALDPKGEAMYLADLDNTRIRKVDLKSGTVTTVAGNGKKGVPEDGAVAKDAPLVDPRAVTADRDGNVWVLERGGHALRVVSPDGKIRTVAGTGKKGNSGDGGDARMATLNGPKHLGIDLDGNLLIADTENHVIRKYLVKEGKIVRIAGSGKKGSAGIGGPALEVELNQPHGVYQHPDGTLYIADSSNDRVLKIVK